jgi:hypothetical protein
VDNDQIKKVISNKVSRRKFLAGVGAGAGTAAALAVAGCGGKSNSNMSSGSGSGSGSSGITDVDIFNFALNLEYLEAEYYVRAATGSGLSASDTGSSGGVTGGSAVNFTDPALKAYALEIAADELAHVRFIRQTLADLAVDEPAIDLTNSFNAAAAAAGIPGGMFNPFADQYSFLLGAFVFEDVGVTAYHGAASLLTVSANLAAAAGIYATEAYHAGEIRTLIAQLGDPYLTYANQISALRAAAGGGAETTLSSSSIVAADSNSIAYDRTTDQVLHIVYLNATAGVVSKGGFFPNGLNGKITASTT